MTAFRTISLVGCIKIAVVCCLLLLGCAEERDPVNRVQPHAIDKAYFIGEDFTDTTDDPEFYSRNHVVDVGFGATGASDGLLFTASPAEEVSRIKWQVTEDYLIGRLAYERITGSDGKGSPEVDKYGRAVGKATNDGIVAVMFKIEGHFDISNDYNPITGEKLNVVEENSEDRPWNERQYMRVDWSQNLSTDNYDFDTLSLIGVYDGIEYEPISYFVDDPTDSDAPVFDFENGYFDVTTKAFAKPKNLDIAHLGWGLDSIPACFFPNEIFNGAYPSGSCSPMEITLRHSFLRVDRNGDGKDDSDYEPRDYDGVRFERFGGFNHERFGYSRNYGMTDETWHRLLNRYNIWQRSHYYKNPQKMTGFISCNTEETTIAGADPNRDNNGNGTADECEAVTTVTGFAGSQCDALKRRCTLPYRAREPKPIPFYYTDTGNFDYFDASRVAVHEWDVALRSAVQTSKYAECVRTATSQTTLPNRWDDYSDAEREALKAAHEEERAFIEEGCMMQYPMWTGQMDDQNDAVFLAMEVDDCRARKRLGDPNADTSSCYTLAEGNPTRQYTEGVKAVSRMEEMIVLCHSPVQHEDPLLCGENRMPLGADVGLCDAAVNTDPDAPKINPELQNFIELNVEIDNLEELVTACNSALRVRHGDLRYHVINVVDKPQEPSPWGIYVSSVDPLTGEVIATNCNVWSHVTDLASQKIVDQMRLIKGELTFQEVTEAENVSEWAKAAEAASKDGVLGTLNREQLSLRLSEFILKKSDPTFLDELEAGRIDGREITDEERELALKVKRVAADIRADAQASSTNAAVYQARRESAKGTEFEAELMTKAIQQLNGLDEVGMTPSAMDMASPLRGGNPAIQRDIRLMMENHLHERNMCILGAEHATASPTALSPLADALEAKFETRFGPFDRSDPTNIQLERAEAMRKYIAYKLHYGVLSHEIGHSIALRHNFVGSADAWSYHPQYWQLRTSDGAIRGECSGAEPSGENCVGPRYIDPVTDTERDNFIHMFMASSIMDYPGEVTQNFMGPGIWDFAATRMFYGDVVSVIDEEDFYTLTTEAQEEANAQREIYTYSKKSDTAAQRAKERFGGILGITYTHGADANGISLDMHYSQLQSRIGMIKDCTTVVDVSSEARNQMYNQFIPTWYREDDLGQWHPVLDGRLVAPGGKNYTRCRQPEVDYVNWSTLRTPRFSGSYDYDDRVYDHRERVVAPYAFGTDRWADLGNGAVYRHDNGADLFEIFNFLITEKELSYIFDRYRRGRSDFSLRSAALRGLSRYDAKIRDGAKGLAFLRTIYDEFISSPVGYNPDKLWAHLASASYYYGLEPNLVASIYAFDHFAKELARPEAGRHGFAEEARDNVLRSMRDSGPHPIEDDITQVIIPNGPTGYWGTMSSGGELLENLFDEDEGEFGIDYYLNSGSYYDKIMVPMLLTESIDNFVSSSRTDFHDPRYRSNSLADLFPDGFRRLIANALTNDETIKGPRLPADQTGRPLTVSDSDLNLGGPIAWTHWDGPAPSHCFPSEGRAVCTEFLLDPQPDSSHPPVVPIDSQIGWEQQKFLIAFTLLFLPENEEQEWLESMRIWEIGQDNDPGFDKRIEFRDPNGRTYVARTFGTEEIFGKTVQKGIAARVLEYANELLTKAYETDPVYGVDEQIIAYNVRKNAAGDPLVLYEPPIDPVYDDFTSEGCDATDNSGCTCADNRYCLDLEKYISVPVFIRQALDAYRMSGPSVLGIYK